MECPNCGFENPEGFKFCGNCTHPLNAHPDSPQNEIDAIGERKHVTIMFSDLSGYTAMNERLDPEEVKEIMGLIFGEIRKIIDKYDGFIEKYIGDAMMAVFGVPRSHEDDPIRAVRAAMEIHALVEARSPELELKVGRPLSMHTGINTGLVVTGEVDVDKGTHGLTGDAINLASRLEGLARVGEILVGERTYNLSKSYFNFEAMAPTRVKGKAEPVTVYRVVSLREQAVGPHRLDGVKAELIGRDTEMSILAEAVNRLKQGQGSIISIVGEAGTGKSRLTREFRASLNADEVQWREGHAYAYTQNTAYYPLINLLSYAFEIREGDKPDQIKEKVDIGVKTLLWDRPEVSKYLGSLFSIKYEDMEEISPEFWRNQLHSSVQQILEAFAFRGPAVILFEDLHWADSSFLELLRFLLKKAQRPVLFICVYRPSFSFFADGQSESLSLPHRVLELRELSWDHTQAMLHSLLKSPNLPDDLRYFIKEKVEGNPFYLEEFINTLIETGILTSENRAWRLTKSLMMAEIPNTIQGVLSSRVDRLEKGAKRIVQEASVIGRAFLQKILEQITDIEKPVDHYLANLEALGLIKTRSLEPDIEYIFKHVLTQEVVYSGLLKKERRKIHERIGFAIESLFVDRLPEFYEALAYHFKEGRIDLKAVDYLMKAGEKCLKKYAVEEAHGHYQTAYDLLSQKPEKTAGEKELLILILTHWALVFYYRGFFGTLSKLLIENEKVASNIINKHIMGMFYAWLGFTLENRFKAKEAYEYLQKSLQIGEEIEDESVVAYACTWLTWTCSSLGLYAEGLFYGNKAQSIAQRIKSDPYIQFKSLAGIGLTYFYQGAANKAIKAGREILLYGQKHSHIRSQAIGHYIIGYGQYVSGNFDQSVVSSENAIKIAVDPFYGVLPNMVIGLCHLSSGRYNAAKNHFKKIKSFGENRGFELLGVPAEAALAVISIAEGQMTSGMRELRKIQDDCIKHAFRGFWLTIELIIGQIYVEMIVGSKPTFGIFIRNIGFLLKSLPFAARRAEKHLKNVIETAKEIGAKGQMGQAFLSLGILHKGKGRMTQAKNCILDALDIFRECEAEGYVCQAKEELESLD